ncbi:hypothetical protein GGR56DRAFT_182464 [Xylariaceae sp. FL0804]|nr:hypothetical protein GGR56DRAFT_182464 [Xylariaceae sp. FL0804]
MRRSSAAATIVPVLSVWLDYSEDDRVDDLLKSACVYIDGNRGSRDDDGDREARDPKARLLLHLLSMPPLNLRSGPARPRHASVLASASPPALSTRVPGAWNSTTIILATRTPAGHLGLSIYLLRVVLGVSPALQGVSVQAKKGRRSLSLKRKRSPHALWLPCYPR